MRVDLNEKGLRRIVRSWQVKTLEYLWTVKTTAGSREIWSHLDSNEVRADPNSMRPVSRASVINFLNQMVDERLVDFDFGTGKGGTHRLYRFKPELNTRESFKQHLYTKFTVALDDFLEEQ